MTDAKAMTERCDIAMVYATPARELKSVNNFVTLTAGIDDLVCGR